MALPWPYDRTIWVCGQASCHAGATWEPAGGRACNPFRRYTPSRTRRQGVVSALHARRRAPYATLQHPCHARARPCCSCVLPTRGKQPSRKRGVHQRHHGAAALHRVVGAGAQVVQQKRGDDRRRRVLRRDAQARQHAKAGQGDARGAAASRNRLSSAQRAWARACGARTEQT